MTALGPPNTLGIRQLIENGQPTRFTILDTGAAYVVRDDGRPISGHPDIQAALEAAIKLNDTKPKGNTLTLHGDRLSHPDHWQELRASKLANEGELTNYVIDLCDELGWRCIHIRPARTEKGWRTPIQGDGKGWPDIVALRGSRMVVAELKHAKNGTDADQELWLEAFRQIPGAEVFVWRTGDEDAIREVLS